MGRPFLICLLLGSSFSVFAQVTPVDSIGKLNEVVVKGYYNPQRLLRSTAAVNLIDSNQLKNQSPASLVGTVNTIPGVRMEERSPGSYRLSMRGSLLRSPFGIRNIKIYIDDFPLTDAGGNTYLNSLDVAAIGSIEIYKGPESSSFGANTGGVVLINTATLNTSKLGISLTAGSYGLFQQAAQVQQTFNRYQLNISQGYQQSDGYRENSALKRKYFQTTQKWDYNDKGQLKLLLFYSDLSYETPGGLTGAQLEVNPKLARPATPTLPGAIQQQAGIFNKTLFGGLAHSYEISNSFKHVVALFGTHTDFENPFITNYEKRKENSIGLRTFLDYNHHTTRSNSNIQLGLESSRTKSKIDNYNNNGGDATSLQASDDLVAHQDFAFLRLNFDLDKRLLLELGASLNFFNYQYESFFPTEVAQQERSFKARLMPKVAASYLVNTAFTIRGSVSKGYSPPTLAEVRSSDNIINNNLQAEAGWNYEGGLRYQNSNNRIYAEATVFYFHLADAIVRRLNTNDIEYFINAGGTQQLGTEVQVAWWAIQDKTALILNGLQLKSGFTYSHFRFEDLINGSLDFSGNRLTGVPRHTIVSSVEVNVFKRFFLFAQHNYTATIPLNDANTVFAKKYHLADLKLGIRSLRLGKAALDLSVGINNLFNQKYSLGNDLNAANNRYYNPAAGINFYSGIGVRL